MTSKAHRRHRVSKIKAAAKLAFIFGLATAVCGFVIYTFLTLITCPP